MTAQKKNLGLVMGAIGVVYGDIGTSPLYAFRESLAASGGGERAVLGVVSLILWALIIVVTIKYVFLLLRADNHGEGGILSLMALAAGDKKPGGAILMLGIAGAALFYGDAIITPAISVLSAVEGLKLVTHSFKPYVIPVSVTILALLFAMQRRGTEKVAAFFGPVMLLWFLALAWGGIMHMADSPEVLEALNPIHGISFLANNGMAGAVALGAVFLSVTGAEALYADLGHFGKKPIRVAWLLIAFPSLALNYFGQGALALSNPEAAENPFYLLYPSWALVPMVILSTIATVIASQAVITGAFSLTSQAVRLGLLPRLSIQHTSEEHAGQIYMPQANWLMLAGIVLLIEIFHNSSNLAAAYGIAVTGTMVITASLAFIVARKIWKWNPRLTAFVIAPLMALDMAFFLSNLTKFFEGGFLPVMMSGVLFVMMLTWVRGAGELHEQDRDQQNSMENLLERLNRHPVQRVEGTAVFLSSNAAYAPSALIHNLKHNRVLHEHNILLTVRFANQPRVDDGERIETVKINRDFTRVFLSYGFMETPNIAKGLSLLREKGFRLDMMSTTFFISRRNIVPSARFGMPLWQDRIFIAMSNNASDAAAYFHIPQSRVVELGVQMTV